MMASAPFSPAFCVISSTVPWTTSLGGSYGIFPFRPSSGKSLRFDGVAMVFLRVEVRSRPRGAVVAMGNPQAPEKSLEYLVGYMFDTSIAALRLVLSGIVEQLPELKIVHPHCGATLPYLAGRIDASYVKPYSIGVEWPEPPSARLARMYTDTMSQSEETLAFARCFYGDGNVMFGSDFPYFEPPSELAFVRQATADDPAILGGNAAALFGIPG